MRTLCKTSNSLYTVLFLNKRDKFSRHNTVFLCSKFKLENIDFGCSKCLREFLFADHCKNRKNFMPHGIICFKSMEIRENLSTGS